ncbi:hypothetical protein F5141DRAFT_1060825 [Pisolithus sp. B1]|nr:hypothetical protein F5141DRAFT_1060825 [Pisolithus sp. B1]
MALEGLEPSGMALVWGLMMGLHLPKLVGTSFKHGQPTQYIATFLVKCLEHFCIKSPEIGALDSSGRLGASGVALVWIHWSITQTSVKTKPAIEATSSPPRQLFFLWYGLARIPFSQHAPTSVTEPASLEHLTSGVTTNRPKPWQLVKPPEGWEEHMFGLRDRRHSLTPLASSTGALHLPSPSVCQQGQIHNENTMMDKVQELTDDEDRLKSNNEEGSKEGSKGSTEGSNYAENKESSSNCEGFGALLSGCGWLASGVHSSLPPSLLLADWTDDSGPDAEETMASPHQGHQMYWRLQKKGKGRALDTEDVDLADHSDHEMPPPYSKKLGNLSKVVLEEIWALVRDIKMTAQELGQWHGQSTHNILVTAGFGVKPSHTKINEVNLFHLWYWAMQPKPAGVNRDTLNNLIIKEYNTLMQDILKNDLATRRERLQAVYEWIMSGQVLNLTFQQAEAWSNLKDIKIIGVVMYVRQDPAGCQTSGIFGGSEVIRNFINEHGVNVWALMDKCVLLELITICRCLRNGDGTEAGLLSTGSAGDATIVLELCCHIKETPRDCNCRVFGSMMKEKLLAALKDLCLTHGIELLKFMHKYHLTIINWPCGVSPLGPGFDHKKLKAGPLRQLVVPYLLRKLGHMSDRQTDDEEEQDSLDDVPKIEIKCWNQDIIDIPDENPLKSEIPIVKAANGTILWKILDDEWQKSCQERDCQQQDTEAHWQCQLPFPSHKQPHVETSKNDTIPHMVLTLEKLAHLTFLHWLHGTRILRLTELTIVILAHLTSHTMHYHPPTTTASCHLVKPAVPHWVNRGGTTQQYEDNFPGDYIDDY